eukprot:Selendium_serpulae@DN6188_c0_g2_i4.p1
MAMADATGMLLRWNPSKNPKNLVFRRVHAVGLSVLVGLVVLSLFFLLKRITPPTRSLGSPPPMTQKVLVPQPSVSRKIRVGVGACSRARPEWKDLAHSPIGTILIPSILETVLTEEREKYEIRLYIGADDDDQILKDGVQQFRELLPDWLTGQMLFFPKKDESRIPFNPMMAAMYDDGVDYMMRTNDDSEFVTRGWITDAIKVLKSYNPPNIGVVGPNHTGGNTVIITHDMVHRSHLNIFDTYYPVEFQNWFVDTWMTNVYGPERTCKMSNWGVKHLVLPSRYKVDFKKDILSSVLDKSRQVLKERLAEIPSEEPGELKEPLDLDQICVTRKS